MARYEIVFRKSVAKDFDRIPSRDARRILKAIKSLADDPRPPQSRKLTGDDKYRLRYGVYRVLYTIEDDRLIICVVKVRHRKDAYRP
jgi:mRNA interferase RelE/StbE